MNRKVDKIDVRGINWNDSDRSLARKLNLDHHTIASLRDYHGVPRSPRIRSRGLHDKWLMVDWSEKLSVIARKMGVTVTRVSQVKKQLRDEGLL